MGKQYIRMGGRMVEIDHIEQGVPVIKASAEEIKHPDGRVDVVVHVACMTLGLQNTYKET